MTNPSLILIGAGGHARSCIDVIEQQGQFQIAGLISMPDEVNTQHFGYAVIGTDSDLPELAKTTQYALITIGQIQSSEHRIRLYHQATQLGFQLPIIIAPANPASGQHRFSTREFVTSSSHWQSRPYPCFVFRI